MGKLRALAACAAQRLGLPADIAAGLPRIELDGFQALGLDRHTGILEYSREKIVVALNIGRVTVLGSGLELRQMQRERLCVTGNIRALEFEGGGR